jgi:hypothetical protein
MKITVEATVDLSDVLSSASPSDVLDCMEADDLLREMDETVVCEFVAANLDHTIFSHLDEGDIVSFVTTNITMDTLVVGLHDSDKAELRELLAEDGPAVFSQDELLAIREALTLVKFARAALNADTTNATLDSALATVIGQIK